MKRVRRCNVTRRMARLQKTNAQLNDRCMSMGLEAARHGITEVATTFGLPKQNVFYWKKRALSPQTFHASGRGGNRGKCFSDENFDIIKQSLWGAVQKDPTLKLADYKEIVDLALQDRAVGPANQKYVSRTLLSDIFFAWGWRYVAQEGKCAMLFSTVTTANRLCLLCLRQLADRRP